MVLMMALVVNVSWIMEGCTGKIPPLTALVLTTTPTLGPQWLTNFETGTASVNPYFYNSSNGSWSFLPSSGSPIISPGANGTNYALNIVVAAQGVTGYAPYQAQVNLTPPGSYYNLAGGPYGAGTNGIKFYWKTGSSDSMAARWFIMPAPEQIPPPVGNCPGTGGGCYDTYKKPLSSTGASWTLVSFTWSQFAQSGWGSPQIGPVTATCGVAPCTGSPNLSRILYFLWEEDPNGSPGAVMACDFAVDEIQLF